MKIHNFSKRFAAGESLKTHAFDPPNIQNISVASEINVNLKNTLGYPKCSLSNVKEKCVAPVFQSELLQNKRSKTPQFDHSKFKKSVFNMKKRNLENMTSCTKVVPSAMSQEGASHHYSDTEATIPK